MSGGRSLRNEIEAAMRTAREAAQEAGRIMLKERAKLSPGDIGEKGPNDFVTRVDRLLERTIIGRIRKRFPSDRFLGEEAGGELCSGRLWVIDPLDGTSNYIHRFPFVTVSIALSVDGLVQAGVVHDPLHEETFSCVRGRGAQLNGRVIHVSAIADIRRAFVGTGFPSRYKEHMASYLKQFNAVAPAVASIRRAGSACLDLAYVASGRFDGFWDSCLSPWDMAAGTLLVEGAGGVVSDEHGRAWNLESRGVIAGNRPVQAKLLRLVRS